MVTLTRGENGGWYARKRIPNAVRDEYGRLYGQRYEVKFFADASTREQEARRAFNEWLAETEGRIAELIAIQKGEGISLTRKQARALAGEWYRWFLGRHPTRDELHWDFLRQKLHDALTSFVRNEEEDNDPGAMYRERPEVREVIRPLLADIGETAQFLALKRLVLKSEAEALFLDFLFDDLAEALKRLIRHARGDYSPDKYAERFPAFEGPDSGETPKQLFERWIEARKPARGTIESWHYVFEAMGESFPERSAASISPDEAAEWIQGRITKERSAHTVKKTWLNASKTIFGWGVEHKHITRNPFADVKVTVPKKRKHRETKAFRDDEQKTILGAALSADDSASPTEAAKRWVPWLCAYTGARPGEMTQLRGRDVVKRDGIDALNITPEAGTVKGGAARVVPIHQHLIAQGFLKFVARWPAVLQSTEGGWRRT
ncbi:MAG: hypothetical protein ACRECO_16800 [Xanthobacteraceae bacterium]